MMSAVVWAEDSEMQKKKKKRHLASKWQNKSVLVSAGAFNIQQTSSYHWEAGRLVTLLTSVL